jgi:uroporphyrinogen-III decarboxylase
MSTEVEQLYQARLTRYVAAMRNEKPDRIPIRPFVAEFAGKYAGYSCQEVTYDPDKALRAVRQCAKDFEWDALPANLIGPWSGLADGVGLRLYTRPGIDTSPDRTTQYVEPRDEQQAYMHADEYDAFIADPTRFLATVWIPRVCRDIGETEPGSYRSTLAWLKGGMGLLTSRYGEHTRLMRSQCGTVVAIAGMLKAPFDILADKLRGFRQVAADLHRQPDKVVAACEAIKPHMLYMALQGADPEKKVPMPLWLHRGCVPFLSYQAFEKFYWPTLKQLILELWEQGHQVLFYAEGDWDRNLTYTAGLPDKSIIYHVDRGDIFEVHRHVGRKFCLSGGIPNDLLTFGTPDEVRSYCRKVIDEVARDGGYIMDAGAIIQHDAQIENIRAMTELTLEYGVY